MSKRRVKGEGSVYRRGDGRVVGEYEDANGKRRYISGKAKTEVCQKLRKLLADREEDIAYDSENLTVGGYLDRLNALQVQAAYGRKLEAGLSPRSVEIIHTMLHKALKQAVRWTLIPRNVTEAATPQRPVGKEIKPLSKEQARKLLEASKGDRCAPSTSWP